MNKDKKWMLITYYCPTHGDLEMVEPLEITSKELSKNMLYETQSKKEI